MYYKRDLESKIERYLESSEIIAIFGPRQVGKTTLLKEFYNRVENPVFLTFEDIELKVLFEEDIKSFIALYIDPYEHIFIDEFQYAKMGGKHLKYIYDTTDKKIFISGSSTMELSINAVKYLVGRIFVFNLYSFSFGEFLRVKDENLYKLYSKADENISVPLSKKIYGYLDEYITYGGYPRVILSQSNEEKKEVLKNLLSIYLLRDIKEIAKIADETKMYRLVKALSLQIGNVVVYSELSKLIGINTVQLKEYLSVFEQAFLTKTISPFFTNKQLEIVKNPEIFFFDMGLRNVIIKNFSPLEDRVDKGAMLENFVFRELVERDVKYYRTKNGAEVDFIIDDAIPVEIKSNLSSVKISKSYHYFLANYKPKQGYVLNFNQLGSREFNATNIKFLPHFLAFNGVKDEN
ncbi:MAG: ATPase [uncultured Sulfurovum sp.]|uniref:ATPase n=1 Tax=uncultured Sulfurovum sp. TaxID=269237 RepID=A0A6S6SKM3_9BACT|nr:MAG: ATPase [uncultured Sulfurovum sp.]